MYLQLKAQQLLKESIMSLGGKISPMDGIGPNDLNIQSLVSKVKSGQVNEVIFALSSTMEGDTTNFYIFKQIQSTENSNFNNR